MQILARVFCLFLTLSIQITYGLAAQNHHFPYERRDASASPCYYSAPGSICAAHGSLSDPAQIKGEGRYTAPNEVYCQAICYNSGTYPDKLCTSFSWDSKSHRCITFYNTLDEQGFVAGSSNETYYDLKCFKCIDVCPQPKNANVLVNSGFENSATSLAPFANLDRWHKGSVVSPGFKSSRAYTARGSPNKGGDLLYQAFHACLDTLYLFTFDYKYVWETKQAALASQIETKIEDNDNILRPTLDQNNTWQSHSSLFHTRRGNRWTSERSELTIYPTVGLGLGGFYDRKLFLDNVRASPINL